MNNFVDSADFTTADACQAASAAFTGFQLVAFAWESSTNDCYMFETCFGEADKDPNEGYTLYIVDFVLLPAPLPVPAARLESVSLPLLLVSDNSIRSASTTAGMPSVSRKQKKSAVLHADSTVSQYMWRP